MELKVTLFPNQKKSEKSPDFSNNKVDIGGVQHQVAAWIRAAYNDKPAYLYIKFGLAYKAESGGGEVLDFAISAEKTKSGGEKSPIYKANITLANSAHEVAVWQNNEGRIAITVKPAGQAAKAAAAAAKATAPAQQSGGYEPLGDPSDDLPF